MARAVYVAIKDVNMDSRTSTPITAVNVEVFADDDVSLGAEVSDTPGAVADYSATQTVDGVLVYTHGTSVRVRINVGRPDVLLAQVDWSPDASPRFWRSSRLGRNVRRHVLRGSKWLSERVPKNERLPLVGLNRRWKTRIYSLAIEQKGTELHVDLQVVRYGDLREFFERVLGLQSNEYAVLYYRTLERYIVVPPHEAFRLAERLGTTPENGTGRLSRKRFLVRDLELNVPVRVRARATAKPCLVVYRIDRGATAQYKVEVRLRGQRQNRAQLDADVMDRLDSVLLDLVAHHGLNTVPKPARWEPRTFTTPVEHGGFDPHVRRLPQAAWRGAKVAGNLRRIVRDCHTPSLVKLVACERHSGRFLASPSIRYGRAFPPVSPASRVSWQCVERRGLEVARYITTNDAQTPEGRRLTQPRDPWARIADDIAMSGLYVHEVLLDPEQDPRPLLEALGGGVLGRVGIGAVCAVDAAGHPDTFRSVIDATMAYPFEDDDIDTFVLVFDASADCEVASAVVGRLEPQTSDDLESCSWDEFFDAGPLTPPEGVGPDVDNTAKVTGAWLSDLFAESRRLGEETGIRFVFVTCDARPAHGRGGLRRSHYFHDSRVRSSAGDAGRYYAHQRYLVERVVNNSWRLVDENGEHTEMGYDYTVGNVIAVKDEAEGLPGRLIYDAPVRTERGRWYGQRKRS